MSIKRLAVMVMVITLALLIAADWFFGLPFEQSIKMVLGGG